MRLNPNLRRWLRLQGYLSAVLIVIVAGLLAHLSTRYEKSYDWTAAQRHTLSATSRVVLDNLHGPISITAFVRASTPEDKSVREWITQFVQRYQHSKSDITLEFVNPDKSPDRVRELGVQLNGELVVRFNNRDLHVDTLTEQNLTNALQNLARNAERWVVFLKGHGERDVTGKANQDLGLFGVQLNNRGFKVQTLELAKSGAIPDNTSVLVVTVPQVDPLPAEIKLVQEYISHGGALLLMTDPGAQHGLEPLLQQLGVSLKPGTIVDPTTQRLGIQHPAMALVADYPPHAATNGFNLLTVFPFAAGLEVKPPAGWEGAPLLRTAQAAWSETSALEGEVAFDKDKDVAGPLDIGVALTHKDNKTKKEQRVIVTGDGDFLSNSYLGNSGNLDLGLRLLTWLSGDDALITIPARTAPDQILELPRTATILIGFGFLLVLPLALLAAGAIIWFKRRRR
jgi:ABC-type uncharacterized transport system involved in gliding motility auxiliary subunit